MTEATLSAGTVDYIDTINMMYHSLQPGRLIDRLFNTARFFQFESVVPEISEFKQKTIQLYNMSINPILVKNNIIPRYNVRRV